MAHITNVATRQELQKSAQDLRTLDRQVRLFTTRLIQNNRFADRFDQAVKNSNRRRIRRLFRRGGIVDRIRIIRIRHTDTHRLIRVQVSTSGQILAFRLRYRKRD